MSWFKRVFYPPYQEQADDADFWSEKDAHALYAFLDTHAGRKLKMRLSNYCIRAAMDAVRQKDNSPYNCGVAAGIQKGVDVIEGHAAKPEPEEQEQEQTDLEAIYEQ